MTHAGEVEDEDARRCGPFDIRDHVNEPSGPSRRSLVAFGLLAAAGLVVANVGGAVGSISPAAAEPVWNHPFRTWGEVSSYFGPRVRPCPTCSADHKGIDYFVPGVGSAIHSVAAGTVVQAKLGGGFGNFVEIDHGGSFSTIYAHMQNGSLRVSPGDVIGAGTMLGTMGQTGTATGVHLHLELHINGVPVDPYPRIHRAPRVGDITPRPEPTTPGGKTLFITTATNGSAFLITPFGVAPIGDAGHRDLFIRLLNNPANSQVFLQIEVDIMASYINSLVR